MASLCFIYSETKCVIIRLPPVCYSAYPWYWQRVKPKPGPGHRNQVIGLFLGMFIFRGVKISNTSLTQCHKGSSVGWKHISILMYFVFLFPCCQAHLQIISFLPGWGILTCTQRGIEGTHIWPRDCWWHSSGTQNTYMFFFQNPCSTMKRHAKINNQENEQLGYH